MRKEQGRRERREKSSHESTKVRKHEKYRVRDIRDPFRFNFRLPYCRYKWSSGPYRPGGQVRFCGPSQFCALGLPQLRKPFFSLCRFSDLGRFSGLCHFSVLDRCVFLECNGHRRIAFVQRLTSYLLYPLKELGLSFSHSYSFLSLYFLIHTEHRPIAV